MNNIPHIVDTGASVMNEPVAWAYIKDGEFFDAVHPDEHDNYEGMYKTPLYTHPVSPKYDPETGEPLIDGYPLFSGLPHPIKEQELLDEITKLRWKVNNFEIDIDLLKTTLFDIRQKYDTKNKQYAYTQVYVDELQAKIEALKSHPVKEQDTDCQYCKQGCIRCDARKQLTDEEIKELAMEYLENTGKGIVGVYDFVRAILQKANNG